ncbi:MAG: hypothetical protein QGH11_14420, partial [Pirellulaceae bacterium]|nr:hypothetical protein [Pirellulaceae bacterium]
MDFRRLLLFITCSCLVLFFYQLVATPPPPPAVENQKPAEPEDKPDDNVPAEPPTIVKQPDVYPSKRIVLGSQDPESGFQLVVYFNSLGASIERAELVVREGNSWKYGVLEQKYGYLGYLGLVPEDGGCRVTVVADYSPAARATGGEDKHTGMRAGDLLTGIDEPLAHLTLDPLFDNQPPSSRTPLPGSADRSKQHGPGYDVDVGVLQDDNSVVATQLKQRTAQPLGHRHSH